MSDTRTKTSHVRRPGGSWAVPRAPHAAATARRAVRTWLRRHQVDEDASQTAMLIASELVTNSVEHARGPVVLSLSGEGRCGRLRISVTDGGPAEDAGGWLSDRAEDEQGRGLMLVEAMAERHGTRRRPGGFRTTHWAELAVDPADRPTCAEPLAAR
ncbi:ATP-binding protein [Streptomyces sp. NPDC004822]